MQGLSLASLKKNPAVSFVNFHRFSSTFLGYIITRASIFRWILYFIFCLCRTLTNPQIPYCSSSHCMCALAVECSGQLTTLCVSLHAIPMSHGDERWVFWMLSSWWIFTTNCDTFFTLCRTTQSHGRNIAPNNTKWVESLRKWTNFHDVFNAHRKWNNYKGKVSSN